MKVKWEGHQRNGDWQEASTWQGVPPTKELWPLTMNKTLSRSDGGPSLVGGNRSGRSPFPIRGFSSALIPLVASPPACHRSQQQGDHPQGTVRWRTTDKGRGEATATGRPPAREGEEGRGVLFCFHFSNFEFNAIEFSCTLW